ncbi:MAG: hypothetical protein IRZ19_00035 [Pyrinomonas methylaliphatogenes]|jgi:hypothetical protein|nr:hypothetical protein [Pyrinomonas methylaliphatogenes]
MREELEEDGVKLATEEILRAYAKLFADERIVRRFKRSGVRYIELGAGLRLVEQNPNKESRWAALARQGHRIAWVMRDGEYLARIVDGSITILRD